MKKSILSFLAVSMVYLCTSCDNGDRPMNLPTTNFTVTVENVSMHKMFSSAGVFTTPVGSNSPGPIIPEGAYEFDIKASKGEKLSFVTMFAQSNDLFFAPSEAGIELYHPDGNPRSGDVTDEIMLWDAGTEVNEEPGVGPNQAPRQSAPNTGDNENGVVQLVDDGYTYPETSEVIKVTLEPMEDYMFKVRIENVSTSSTLISSMGSVTIPLSPGGWAVHTAPSPLFISGEAEMENGLEQIAEDGNAGVMGPYLAEHTGLNYPLSPGAWAVHTGGMPIYRLNQNDYGDGLEYIAEDGAPGVLASSLNAISPVKVSGIFNIPTDADDPAPIGPGQKYEFSFSAHQSDKLSLATMFVQSNDLFYAFDDMGIMLFEGGKPISGDITGMLGLYDAGTEVNEEPGYGPNQAIRQAGPDTGETENEAIMPVNDGYSYPEINEIIRVTITAK
ncbi:spondin domain-containing protein [Echinicola salinicaeni]|uniref:spondin domain-containing protein n=1 Tax=Echinicola salinicaeni TaxID=2762757 RepID=UPI0016443030|nr:spondin domain-containing protein [Echinicola salinicaeni]